MPRGFFEGPEKKVELVINRGSVDLRSFDRRTWDGVVEAAQAQILSVVSNEHCDAYLLSESSLFVYDDHLTMITCGQTQLVGAIGRMLEVLDSDSIALLIYERKNEHFPERQPSSFFDDARQLDRWVPGNALQFGDEHDHRIQLFHTHNRYQPANHDTTLEILMHGIPAELAPHFQPSSASETTVAARMGLDTLLPGAEFQIDEHLFHPAGYSLNALRETDYYTIHVTPESFGSYVSFETSFDFREAPNALVERVVGLFQPQSFDVMSFVPGQVTLPPLEVSGYRCKTRFQNMVSGYQVAFATLYRPTSDLRPALQLNLD